MKKKLENVSDYFLLVRNLFLINYLLYSLFNIYFHNFVMCVHMFKCLYVHIHVYLKQTSTALSPFSSLSRVGHAQMKQNDPVPPKVTALAWNHWVLVYVQAHLYTLCLFSPWKQQQLYGLHYS